MPTTFVVGKGVLMELDWPWLLKYIGTTVLGVAFSPDGQTISAVGANQIVYLWDRQTGRDRLKFAGAGLTFSADGQLMASVTLDRRAQLWKVTRGQPFRRLAVRGLGRWRTVVGRRYPLV